MCNRGEFGVSVCGHQEIEELSREGSHYRLPTGVHPSLGGGVMVECCYYDGLMMVAIGDF